MKLEIIREKAPVPPVEGVDIYLDSNDIDEILDSYKTVMSDRASFSKTFSTILNYLRELK